MNNRTTEYLYVDKLGKLKASSKAMTSNCSGFDEKTAARMIEHMNDDHIDAMVDYCRFSGIAITYETLHPQMIKIGTDGFVLQLDNRIIRFEFSKTCKTPTDARKELVELAKRARA